MSTQSSPPSTSSSPPRQSHQRFPSSTVYGISPLLHILLLISHLLSFHYLRTNPTPINASYGWHFQYLTILGLSISLLTFSLALLADILSPLPSLASTTRVLSTLKTTLLFSASGPLEILIFAFYWSLRIIDKDLVIPDWAQLPLLPDLSFHLFPAVGLVVEALCLSPPPRVTVLQGLGVSVALAGGYWPWVEKCRSVNGWYPYPIFDVVGFWGRVGLFVVSAAVMAGNVAVLRWGYVVVNGREGERQGKGSGDGSLRGGAGGRKG